MLRAQVSIDPVTGGRGRQAPTGPIAGPFFPPPAHFPGYGPPGPITFSQIARASGMIFVGTVTKVERGPERDGTAIATVAVTFRVERPLRGAISGESLTIQQWLGLWTGGQRYTVGEHVLLFLYPPSRLGLTSSVAGPMGRFKVDLAGRILLSELQFAVFRSDRFLAELSPGDQRSIGFNDFARALRQATWPGVTQ
ncbi:MAG TPA: hypothetical protein VKR60_09705 [Candidatus Sulfotelmatobacter sp.]|nr:hypothetical protein [Candidatus Sulfotelmatobacter sp.]